MQAAFGKLGSRDGDFHQLVRRNGCVRRYVRSLGIQNGVFDALEMIDLVYAFRSWENDGHYVAWAHERVWDRLGLEKADCQLIPIFR